MTAMFAKQQNSRDIKWNSYESDSFENSAQFCMLFSGNTASLMV